jgi:hypothetical protein
MWRKRCKTREQGTSPMTPLTKYGVVAQLVERRPEEASVGSSSLSITTINMPVSHSGNCWGL